MSFRISGNNEQSDPFFLSANIDRDSTNNWAKLEQPVMYRQDHPTTQEGVDRAYVGNLHYFSSHGDGFWDGATARIYVTNNKVRSLLTTATVTATKVNPSIFNATGTNFVVTATTYQWRVASRVNHAYYLRVAPVNASGEIGTRSGWVTFTPTVINSGTESNPTRTALTYSGTPSALAAPTGVAVAAKSGEPAVAEVTWDAVSGATGYFVEVAWQDPALNVSPEYVDLDTDSLTIPAGAYVILEKLFTEQSTKWLSRAWNFTSVASASNGLFFNPEDVLAGEAGEWIAYSGDKPEGIDAEYFWRQGARASRTRIFNVAVAWSNSTSNEFYEILEPGKTYKARVLMRASTSVSATSAVNFVDNGTSATFNVTTDWQWFEHEFSRDTLLTTPGTTIWSIDAPASAVIDIAAREVFDPSVAIDDLKPQAKSRVTPGSYHRDSSHIAMGDGITPTGRQLFNRRGHTVRGTSFYTRLVQCRLNNTLPWLQAEWHLPNADWLNIVAYLAAPAASGHPMADLRVAQGQSDPWIDEFGSLIIEFGNEAWNTGAGAWWDTVNTRFIDQTLETQLTSEETYAVHVEACIAAMKSSPYWAAMEEKTILYAGGFDANPAWEDGLISAAPSITATGTAPYNGSYVPYDANYGITGGSTVVGETGEAFISLMREYANFSTRKARYDKIKGFGLKVINYEGGPDFGMNANAALTIEQEVVMKSRAAGTATIANVALRAAAGLDVEGFYKLRRDLFWASHSSAGLGGGTYPSWGLQKLVFDAVGPCRVEKLGLTGAVPTQGGVEMIQAFRFKSVATPSTQIIVVCNRDVDVSLLKTDDPLYSATPSGKHLVTVRTNIGSCTGMEYYANVGNFREHNKYPVGFRKNASTFAPDVADSLCVAIDYDWTTGTPPADPFLLTIDDEFGAESDGLRAGNCVLIKLTGCV